MSLRFITVAGAITLAPLGALAQDAPKPLPLSATNEVRIGLNAHYADTRLFPFWFYEFDMNRIEDVSFDLIFASPDVDALRWLGSPRPELGMTLNMGDQESLFHAGLTWNVQIPDTPLFLEGTFGAAVQTGYIIGAPAGHKNLGCRVNFYERIGIGTRITENANALLTYEHTSNADMCEANEGFSNFGIRVGFTF